MACWGLFSLTSSPCLCQSPPLCLSLSILFSASLSVSQPLSLIPAKGWQRDQLWPFQGRKGGHESLPSYNCLERRSREPMWSDDLRPQPQKHPACSCSLSLPSSPQAEPRPTRPGLFPLCSLTPSLRLRSEGGLTPTSRERGPPGGHASTHWICRALCPLHCTDEETKAQGGCAPSP